jgi:hypothetical protein
LLAYLASAVCNIAFSLQLLVLGPQRFNPGFLMSAAEVTAIHGIRDADVAQWPCLQHSRLQPLLLAV